MSPAIPGLCFFFFVASAALGQSVRDEESEQHFRKWLDEDVRFIINPEEKIVFRGLSTPEEKERFIEQFWLRRDRDPKTSINEFKEEHYRRIAYANERFKAGRDGWLTDRGRIYNVFGQPAHIEVHPMGGLHNRSLSEGGGSTVTFPDEVWTYRYIEGLGNDIRRARVEIYNFSVDSATGEAGLRIPLRVLDRNGRVVQETRLDHVGLTYLGERASASTHRCIDGVGDYRAEISIEDLISDRKKDMSVRFRIQDSSG